MLIEMDKNQNRNNKANANSVKVSKTNFTKENGMESEGLFLLLGTCVLTRYFFNHYYSISIFDDYVLS